MPEQKASTQSDAEQLEEELERVRRVGPGLCNRMVENLGSLDAVHEATVEEIATTPGISSTNARAIYREIHETNSADGGVVRHHKTFGGESFQ